MKIFIKRKTYPGRKKTTNWVNRGGKKKHPLLEECSPSRELRKYGGNPAKGGRKAY